MVLITQRLGMADGRSESTEGRSKPGVGWRLTSGEFGNDRCMFIEQRGEYCMQSRGSQVIWVGE